MPKQPKAPAGEAVEWSVLGADDEGEWITEQQWHERHDAQSWADVHGGTVVSRRVTEWEPS